MAAVTDANCTVNTNGADLWFLVTAGANGQRLAEVDASPHMTGREFLSEVSALLGECPARCLLLREECLLLADESLADQGCQDDAVVTFLCLAEPTSHGGVHDCEICDLLRFCHFGPSYLMDFPRLHSPVCELCGGGAAAQVDMTTRRWIVEAAIVDASDL